MPIYPKVTVTQTTNVPKVTADTSTPFEVTLTAAATAQDLVTVPALKKGRTISLVNEGPGDIALAFDATATASDLLIKDGEAYSEANLDLSTKVSFINVTPASTPKVRGVLWSGDPT